MHSIEANTQMNTVSKTQNMLTQIIKSTQTCLINFAQINYILIKLNKFVVFVSLITHSHNH